MACDFLAPESIPSTKHVVELFREHRRLKINVDKPVYPMDVMQLYTTLYSTWNALRCFESAPSVSDNGNGAVAADLHERIFLDFPGLRSSVFFPSILPIANGKPGPEPIIDDPISATPFEDGHDSESVVADELQAQVAEPPPLVIQEPMDIEQKAFRTPAVSDVASPNVQAG